MLSDVDSLYKIEKLIDPLNSTTSERHKTIYLVCATAFRKIEFSGNLILNFMRKSKGHQNDQVKCI